MTHILGLVPGGSNWYIIMSTMEGVFIFFEQVGVMTWKNLHQKRLAGRSTLKEILTPLGLIGFWIYIMVMSSLPQTYPDAVYEVRDLPPISSQGTWGIFRDSEDDPNGQRVPDVIDSKRLFYSPNTHQGVNELVCVCEYLSWKWFMFVRLIFFVLCL